MNEEDSFKLIVIFGTLAYVLIVIYTLRLLAKIERRWLSRRFYSAKLPRVKLPQARTVRK